MMRSVAVKFVCFVLAAVFLVCAAGALLGVGVLGFQGLYDSTLQQRYDDRMEDYGRWIAENCVRGYASRVLGQCPEPLLEQLVGDLEAGAQGRYNARIKQEEEVLWSVTGIPEEAYPFEYSVVTDYYCTTPPENAQISASWNTSVVEGDQWVDYTVYQCLTPAYTVYLQLSPSYVMGVEWALAEALYAARYWLIVLAAVSLVLFAAFLVCLFCAAGRTPDTKAVRAGGLNRLPLDLYTAILGVIGYLLCFVGVELLNELVLGQTALILAVMLSVCLSLLVMAFLFALAAQIKTKGGYWWRNSLTGRCLLAIFRGIRRVCRGIYRLFLLIPVIWRLALAGLGIGLLLYVVLIIAWQTSDLLWELGVILVPGGYLALLGYLCYAYGSLFRGMQKMQRGDLSYKISTRFLFGSFKEFAQGLNAVSEAAALAAEKQLRSERMKTELITNVSHDIKTPLTSIINYVDLLQKPHSPEEGKGYLEVLSRQSLRLKKLVEDLMEMSKASTGNITAHCACLDGVEAVNQALGEFSDKLRAAGLTAVVDAPREPVWLRADSRLLWRVLSNLLSNAVKYALPGTRLYVSIRRHERHVLISLKNVSREQLGISAEELMERFVRGDTSRNTEGSGLGLNIAKSLMELQKGQLKLTVDGDLFKVTLVFPTGK